MEPGLSDIPVNVVEKSRNKPEADPGFPTGCTNHRGMGPNLLFGKTFVKDCMKMKEIGPGEHVPRATPTHTHLWIRDCLAVAVCLQQLSETLRVHCSTHHVARHRCRSVQVALYTFALHLTHAMPWDSFRELIYWHVIQHALAFTH